jgi:hypothetical protein
VKNDKRIDSYLNAIEDISESDVIHTPSIYIQRLILGENYEKRIERRTVIQA